jgi:hypothetical protein
VIHFRLHKLAPDRLERVHAQVEELAAAREWRSQPIWIASRRSRGLFESEYFRHLLEAEGATISAAGFLKMNGDETDALVLLFFLRDLSAEYGVRVVWHDEENPLMKLRFMEFRSGLLPTGQTLEDHLAKRPVVKKVMGQAIIFYPPGYRVHRLATPTSVEWGYAIHGLRAYAPTLFEAEQEALKIVRAHRHLG